ncbi:MAG: hypothetical protein WA667_03185 [Candidatus Nitrosopolaris sp.]
MKTERWKGFALRTERRSQKCLTIPKQLTLKAVPTESLVIAILFSRHKLIEWLEGRNF